MPARIKRLLLTAILFIAVVIAVALHGLHGQTPSDAPVLLVDVKGAIGFTTTDYFAKALEPIKAPLRDKPFDFDERELKIYEEKKETETFRFIDWKDVSADIVTLPIDKLVVEMLKKQF